MIFNGRLGVRLMLPQQIQMFTADPDGQVHISTHSKFISSRGVSVLNSITNDVVNELVSGLPPLIPVVLFFVNSQGWSYRRHAELLLSPPRYAMTCLINHRCLLFLSSKENDWHGNEYRSGVIRLFEIEGEECGEIDRRTNHRPGDRPL